MSIIENNFNEAVNKVGEKVEEEKQNRTISTDLILVQISFNPDSFALNSVALNSSQDGNISEEVARDSYYNMVFVADSIDEVTEKFRNKYLFKLAYSEVSFAMYEAYKNALKSETGEYVFKTSFEKSSIEDYGSL